MKDLLYRLVVEEDGPTSVEYAVMLALLVATCISSVNLLSNITAASFDDSAAQINTAMSGS